MERHKAASGSPDQLAHYLLKGISKANRLYRLFEAGDRIAVAVSGGKDSATLLDLLRLWPGVPRFELRAIHVHGSENGCADGLAPDALLDWFSQMGVEGAIAPLEPANGEPAREGQGPCFHCAWRRRKALFTWAREMGCNKLALAHHADDVAVTMLLNLTYQGRFETMQPRQPMFDGSLTILRPLYLIEERAIARYARSGAFPFEAVTCASGADSRRTRMAEILRLLEGENRRVKRSFMNALEHACPPPARGGK